jgi:hypothetical protein
MWAAGPLRPAGVGLAALVTFAIMTPLLRAIAALIAAHRFSAR